MLLQMNGIGKSFPGTRALSMVDFELEAGEVHVLFGENGAGKSTLINVIAGTFAQDEGAYVFQGEIQTATTPSSARARGIAAVFQEFSLVPSLNAVDNLFLGREIHRFGLLDRRTMRARAVQIFQDLGFAVDLDVPISQLSRASKQMTEIAKALLFEAALVILDEPTASLSDHEADQVLGAVRQLKSRGVGVIYVSHRLREITAIADRITVLRAGESVATVAIGDVTMDRLVELMIGRRLETYFPEIDHRPNLPKLVVSGISTANRSLRNVSLEVRGGEIVGVAGLVGGGKGALGPAIFGLEEISSGTVAVSGYETTPDSPRQMLQRGLCYFPADRGADGLALNRTILENASIAALDVSQLAPRGLIDRKREREAVEETVKALAISPTDITRPVGKLSGGNKQKVLLARGLMRDLNIFIFDEPTVGIDVGAKVEVYAFMKQLVDRGAAVLLISSELSEVINMSHRVYVMHQGEIVLRLDGEAISETAILEGFFGRSPSTTAIN